MKAIFDPNYYESINEVQNRLPKHYDHKKSCISSIRLLSEGIQLTNRMKVVTRILDIYFSRLEQEKRSLQQMCVSLSEKINEETFISSKEKICLEEELIEQKEHIEKHEKATKEKYEKEIGCLKLKLSETRKDATRQLKEATYLQERMNSQKLKRKQYEEFKIWGRLKDELDELQKREKLFREYHEKIESIPTYEPEPHVKFTYKPLGNHVRNTTIIPGRFGKR